MHKTQMPCLRAIGLDYKPKCAFPTKWIIYTAEAGVLFKGPHETQMGPFYI